MAKRAGPRLAFPNWHEVFRRWMASWEEGEGSARASLSWLLLVLGALFLTGLGYFLGQQAQ